jgi:undecaprenyl-phosphate 4-deoxy-4-formamido-L-arabinose transferase
VNVSVVIPVFNSERSLRLLVERLEEVLTEHAEAFEVILVNDGSQDASWEIVSQLANEHPWVSGIDLARNYGQHNALLCGIRAARYEITVTMDDDLQNPPEEIPKLLAGIGSDADVVYGTPDKQQRGILRRLASAFVRLTLHHAMGRETARSVSSFRAFNTKLRTGFSGYGSPSVSIDVLLAWSTHRFASTPVRHDARESGRSTYAPRLLLAHAFDMLTGFSTLPLQVASLAGFAFTVVGFLILLYVVVSALVQESRVPGFAFLASTIALFAGVQLFALGIIGEYLARIHFRSMKKPAYVIGRTTRPAGVGSEG